MSDIILARTLIRQVLKEASLDSLHKRKLRKALRLMTREPAIRRTTRKRPVKITSHLRGRIRELLKTDMTMHQIATLTGVNNSGRISEVAHGKR
jgi:hypothetical protein